MPDFDAWKRAVNGDNEQPMTFDQWLDGANKPARANNYPSNDFEEFDDWSDLFPNHKRGNSVDRAPSAPLPYVGVDGGDAYGLAALRGELAKIAATGPTTHNRNQTLNDSWFNLVGLCRGGQLDYHYAKARIIEAVRATGLPEWEITNTMHSAENGSDRKVGARRAPALQRDDIEPAFVIDEDGNPVDVPANVVEDELRQLYSDVAAFLAGERPEPTKPTRLLRTDGVGIFYPGKHNTMISDPEVGKTMVAQTAGAETLAGGGSYLFMDLDTNGMEETVERLRMLGATDDALSSLDRFRHCQPEDAAEVLRAVRDCAEWLPDMVVIDCIGELCVMFGANSDKADDYTRVVRTVIKPLTKLGCTVVTLDHLAKGTDSRQYGAGGTMAKRRVIEGTSIGLRPVKRFIPDQGGSVELIIEKDRPGGLRRHCPPPRGGEHRQKAGTFIMDPPEVSGGRCQWRIDPPLATRATSFDDQELIYLEAARALPNDSFTCEELATAVDDEYPLTEASREKARRNLKALTEQGRVEVVNATGRKGKPQTWRVVPGAVLL